MLTQFSSLRTLLMDLKLYFYTTVVLQVDFAQHCFNTEEAAPAQVGAETGLPQLIQLTAFALFGGLKLCGREFEREQLSSSGPHISCSADTNSKTVLHLKSLLARLLASNTHHYTHPHTHFCLCQLGKVETDMQLSGLLLLPLARRRSHQSSSSRV